VLTRQRIFTGACNCAAQVAATAEAHAKALRDAAASADARLQDLQGQVAKAQQANVAASTGQAMARAHARDAEEETKAAQERAQEAVEALEVMVCGTRRWKQTGKIRRGR